MKQETKNELDAMLKIMGKVDNHGVNKFTNRYACYRRTDYRMKNMISKIKSSIKGDWHRESDVAQLMTPIKVHVEYNIETNIWGDYISEHFLECLNDNFQLQIFPFDDGLMVHSLIVNKDKRGQSIGSDVMNTLYDISDKMEIPLYLIPFPAIDHYEQSEIFEIVKPLHKWYDKLDFGPLEGRGLLWSNY